MESTNQPEQPKEYIRIEFEVMGFCKEESDFLNKTLENYSNIKFLIDNGFFNSMSVMLEVYFNDLKEVKEFRKPTICKRK